MRTLITILFSVNLLYLFGQSAENNVFSKRLQSFDLHNKAGYEKFNKTISFTGNGFYKFGDKVLSISVKDSTLLILFHNGIFNPDVIFGEQTTHKDKQELDTLSQIQKTFYNLSRNDSLSICCFEQVNVANQSTQTKRYKFWVFKIGISNPIEYFIELFNKDAKQETTLKDFLEHSVMTFFNKGSLVI